MKSHQPVVNGVAVLRCVEAPWEPDDDAQLVSVPDGDPWTVVGRASVIFPEGGLANGLLLKRERPTRLSPLFGVVIWERPREGGAGRFRLVPLGDWS